MRARSFAVALSLCIPAAGTMANAPGAAAQAGGEAASYPSRNITWMVGFPAGGPPDVVARTVAPAMSEILGKPIVVENRPGASGSIAATQIARAAPDGHTIGSYDIAVIVAPMLMATPGYDPAKDFVPIVFLARTGVSMVVSPSLGPKTLPEFIAFAKQKPGEVKLAHAGIGSPPHLSAAAFLQATRTNMLLVPYRGAAPAIQDVVAGHVSALFTGPSTSIALARDGKVVMLGITGAQRLKSMPEVPTFRQSGVAIESFDDGQWFGLMAPAGTPAAIVAKLNAAANEVLKRADVQERFAKVEFATVGGSAEALTRMGQSQAGFWRETLKAAGVKPE